MNIQGFQRGSSFGIRNHVIALASVSCANSIVEALAAADDAVIPVTHQHGCTHLGDDRRQVLRTLAGTCANPNVAGALIVGLGCESTPPDQIAALVPTDGRVVRTLLIQDVGDPSALLGRGLAHIAEMKAFAAGLRRRPFDLAGLVLGVECGGSDPFSGLTANPAVGLVSDRVVAAGGTVILSEITEMIGAEEALAPRIPDPAVRQRLFERINAYVGLARQQCCDLRGVNPTPGNIAAGLSTIEEKSLGCICKGGRSDIVEFLAYAERPTRRGLVVMDTPGNDPESLTGMAAGGAHVMLFTTGVGTPLGNPVAPVVKIASNTAMYNRMRPFMDVNAGAAIDGLPLASVADDLLALTLRVCDGELTAAERNRCREFAINRIGPTY